MKWITCNVVRMIHIRNLQEVRVSCCCMSFVIFFLQKMGLLAVGQSWPSPQELNNPHVLPKCPPTVHVLPSHVAFHAKWDLNKCQVLNVMDKTTMRVCRGCRALNLPARKVGSPLGRSDWSSPPGSKDMLSRCLGWVWGGFGGSKHIQTPFESF